MADDEATFSGGSAGAAAGRRLPPEKKLKRIELDAIEATVREELLAPSAPSTVVVADPRAAAAESLIFLRDAADSPFCLRAAAESPEAAESLATLLTVKEESLLCLKESRVFARILFRTLIDGRRVAWSSIDLLEGGIVGVGVGVFSTTAGVVESGFSTSVDPVGRIFVSFGTFR